MSLDNFAAGVNSSSGSLEVCNWTLSAGSLLASAP